MYSIASTNCHENIITSHDHDRRGDFRLVFAIQGVCAANIMVSNNLVVINNPYGQMYGAFSLRGSKLL